MTHDDSSSPVMSHPHSVAGTHASIPVLFPALGRGGSINQVALTDLTKQFAKQALGQSAKNVLDALRPSELPKVDAPAPAMHESHETVGAVIVAELKAMQNALKDDAELIVLVHTGLETLRVLEVYVPAPQVAVLIGIDTERNVTRFISRIDSLQLTCKVMPAQAGSAPVRVKFIVRTPKPA